MSKYIDAEKLITKIKELNLVTKTYDEQVAFNNALAMVVEIIDSLQQEQKDILVLNKKDWEEQEQFRKDKKFGIPLQQEQPEVDLEKEIDKFFNETGAPYVWCNDDEQKEWCNIIARHFAEWGAIHLNARKEK